MDGVVFVGAAYKAAKNNYMPTVSTTTSRLSRFTMSLKSEQALAAIYMAPNKPIVVRNRPIPEPAPNQILVKLVYSGICHSDLHAWLDDLPIPLQMPLVGGHEGTGFVHKIGATAAGNWSVGDRVGVKYKNNRCNCCTACKRGLETLCPVGLSTGFFMDGTFQQYALIEGAEAIRIPKSVDLAEAAPILCAGTTVYRALLNANLHSGDYVAIVGAGGGLGTLAVQYARALSYRVIALDMAAKRQRVLALGADHYVAVDEVESVPDAVNKLTDGGAHAILNLAASAKVTEGSIAYIRTGGTVVLVALDAGNISLPLVSIIMQTITVRGTLAGSRDDTDAAMSFLERGLIKTHIDQIVGLSELEQTFKRLQRGEIVGKVIIDLWKE